MSEISAPLILLLENNIEWHWEELQETSFQKLKQMGVEAPVLGFYDPKEELVLNVDAFLCFRCGNNPERKTYSIRVKSPECCSTEIQCN